LNDYVYNYSKNKKQIKYNKNNYSLFPDLPSGPWFWGKKIPSREVWLGHFFGWGWCGWLCYQAQLTIF
jgi:hypothetical protein